MDRSAYAIKHFQTEDGHDPVLDWLMGLRDKRVRAAVLRHLDRLASGDFGDHRYCPDGVWELRIDIGPGYRAFYAMADHTIILLICSGDTRRQQADAGQVAGFLH